jgi:hypothetical protein
MPKHGQLDISGPAWRIWKRQTKPNNRTCGVTSGDDQMKLLRPAVPLLGLRMLVLALIAVLPGTAQAQRKAKPPEPPPQLDASFPATIARCSATYGATLAGKVRASLAADATRATEAISVPGLGWPGRWLHVEPTAKQLKADALAAAEQRTQERICKDRQKRAGRLRCTEWEQAATPASAAPTTADATVPTPPQVIAKPAAIPPPADDELRDIKLLTGYVAAKGQLVEFGRNGRLEALIKRLAGDLSAYVAQPAHPALCNGAPEMLDFHGDRMDAVQIRLTAIAELAARTRALAEQRVSAAINPAGTPAGIPPPPGTPAATTKGRPMAALVLALSQLMLPADAARAAAITPPGDVLGPLRRLMEAARTTPWVNEPADVQVSVGQALRALEAAIYADQQQLRASAVERTIFGALATIRAAHTTHCTCVE